MVKEIKVTTIEHEALAIKEDPDYAQTLQEILTDAAVSELLLDKIRTNVHERSTEIEAIKRRLTSGDDSTGLAKSSQKNMLEMLETINQDLSVLMYFVEALKANSAKSSKSLNKARKHVKTTEEKIVRITHKIEGLSRNALSSTDRDVLEWIHEYINHKQMNGENDE
ncbi:MAG: hypothetical protein ABI348_06730 [Nitrososphaera sp.]